MVFCFLNFLTARLGFREIAFSAKWIGAPARIANLRKPKTQLLVIPQTRFLMGKILNWRFGETRIKIVWKKANLGSATL